MEPKLKIDVLKQLYVQVNGWLFENYESINELNDFLIQIRLFITNEMPINNRAILYNLLDEIRKYGMVSGLYSKEENIHNNYIKKTRALQFIRMLMDTVNMYELNNVPETELSLGTIYMDGQSYDATSKIIDIIQLATDKIILVDNYIDRKTLELLKQKQQTANLFVITQTNKIDEASLSTFKQQYGVIIVESNKFHDRYLIIDDRVVYLVGSSIKDIGKKVTTICQISDVDDIIFKTNSLLGI